MIGLRWRQGTSHLLAFGLGLLILGTFLLPSTASAQATRMEFEGAFYPCSETPPTEVWISGNVLHFRGATNHNQWVTGNPLVDGFADNVFDGNINLKTGTGVAHPKNSLKPDAFDGTWEMVTTVEFDPSGLTAFGVGRGTGELHGMTIKVTFLGPSPIDPADNPCSDTPSATLLKGEIIAPASRS